MPARKRRGDLTVAPAADAKAQAQAQAQIAGLHEAATRAQRLHDWQAAARPGAEPLFETPAAPAAEAAKPRNRLRWPFGRRKAEPEAELRAAILSELEASVAGRPQAGATARAAEAQSKAQPAAEPLRAAG
jgi:hypothetical protein